MAAADTNYLDIVDGPGRGEFDLMTLTVAKAFPQIIYLLKVRASVE